MTALGIDIGGTRIKAGLVDGEGHILASEAAPSPPNLTEFREILGEIISALTRAAGMPTGVGIGCKGIIEPESTRVLALPGTMHYLEGVLLADLIEMPGVPVRADNDARVALAGELLWGAARGCRNAVLLTLGTGVGGAAVVEGNLLRGSFGAGAHLGHLTVDPDGAVCICGNRGCLETVFSARAIEAEAISAVLRGCASKLRLQYHDRIQKLTCQAVFDLAAEGDELAVAIRDRAVKYLAGAIAGIIFAFDPELVLVGGQIADAGDSLFTPLREQVHGRTRPYLRREVPVIATAIGDVSGVVGAAALVAATETSKSVQSGT